MKLRMEATVSVTVHHASGLASSTPGKIAAAIHDRVGRNTAIVNTASPAQAAVVTMTYRRRTFDDSVIDR